MINLFRFILLLVVLVGTTWTSVAQLSQPRRFEKEQKFSDDVFSIITLEEEGLALFRETNDFEKGDQLWELIILDTALHEKSKTFLQQAARNEFIGHDFQPGELSLLFRTGQTERSPLTLVVYGLDSLNHQAFDIKLEISLRLTHFTQVGTSFAFGGYVSNEPAIVLFSSLDQSMLIVPGFFQKDMELVDVRTNKDHQTFNTVLIDRSNRDDRKLVFRTFDLKGNLLLEDVIDVDEDKVLINGLVSSLEREDLVIMGTWGPRNAKQASGIYAVTVDPFEKQSIQYINFGQMEHVFDYMKPKRAKKIKEKMLEDVREGRNPAYTTYVMPFRILEHPRGFVLLADIYNPSSTYSRNYYSPYGSYPYYYDPYWGSFSYPRRIYNRPYSSGNNMMQDNDNIKTYESFLVSLDGRGKLSWDHSFALDDVRSSSIDQTADFALVNDYVYFVYKKEKELRVKQIPLSDDVPTEYTENIKLSSDLDELRSESEREGSVRYWFGHSFYVWGVQNIRNKTEADKTRRVFYINKLVAH